MAIPISLENSLREGRVVPFAGAGVSMAVLDRETKRPIFPSWRQLLLAAADRLRDEQKPKEGNLVHSLMEVAKPDFLYAANAARNSLGAVWYSFLKDQLDIPEERVDEASLALARSMWQVGSNLIITTNYDEVLKWACPYQNLQTWDIEAAAEQVQLLQGRLQRPTIWHLHGSILNAAEIILARDSYDLLYPNQVTKAEGRYKAALETLRNQLASKTFLFIGFSLDDKYFGFQLKDLAAIYQGGTGPHFALIRQSDEDQFRQLSLPVEPIIVSNFGDPLIEKVHEISTYTIDRAIRHSKSVLKDQSTIPVADYDPKNPIFYVPFRQKGDQVVGQEGAIKAVRKQLSEGKPTAIGQTAAFMGLGGLGKTQLAIEYAYRFRADYPNGVIWINADQDIDAQLIEIADKGRWVAQESEHKYKLQIAQHRIRTYSDCLIIFDNVEHVRVLDGYLPEPDANPHILITSRTDHMGFVPVPLDVLNEEHALRLLLQESGRMPTTEVEREAAIAIVRDLGGLPLALELAGGYLQHKSNVSFEDYQKLLGRDLKTALPSSLFSFTQHEADLYHTLRVSETLFEEDERLRDVLNLLSWSGSAPFSTDLMLSVLGFSTETDLINALALGSSLRLLQPAEKAESYSLHRLVAEVRRRDIPLNERKDWVGEVCKRVGDWFQERREDFADLSSFEYQIDHLKAWQRNASLFSRSNASRLMWLQAYPSYHRARYREARELLSEASALFSNFELTDGELEANLLNDLAVIDGGLGDRSHDLEKYIAALNIRKHVFGDIHKEIAQSLANIGGSYEARGDLRRALDYAEQAFAMRRKLFGDKHPDLAKSLNTIGKCHGEQGDLRLAIDYGEQALAMQRELFGDKHPDIATSLNNIGAWYGRQGDQSGAIDYAEQALAMQREVFGDKHPDIAISLNNIGTLYGEQGDVKFGLVYVEQALAMRRELFGDKHPDVATSLLNLGLLHAREDDLKSALDYLKQALSMYRELLGDTHPKTIRAVTEFANVLIRLNRRQPAYLIVDDALRRLPRDYTGIEGLQRIKNQLLSTSVPKGFRQRPKRGKSKTRKRRS